MYLGKLNIQAGESEEILTLRAWREDETLAWMDLNPTPNGIEGRLREAEPVCTRTVLVQV